MKSLLWLITAVALSGLVATSTANAQNLNPVQLAIASSITANQDPITVVPFEFDPFEIDLVRARWMIGIGCPTNATINTTGTSSGNSTVTDACMTGDSKDKQNEGLLLVKTGPTNNFAAAGASPKGVNGLVLTELGYDIRKPGVNANDPRGSHCGAGAPRFNISSGGHTPTSWAATHRRRQVMLEEPGWQRLRLGFEAGRGLPVCCRQRRCKCAGMVLSDSERAASAPRFACQARPHSVCI